MANDNLINFDAQIYNYASLNSLREDDVLKDLREETKTIVGREMQVTPEQGQFMYLLAKLINAKKILEIGTFTGYSTLSFALALPEDGEIITCDKCKESTSIAQKYWKRRGLDHKIKLFLAPALDTLESIKIRYSNSFDLVFIDADKRNYQKYYEASLKLLRPRGLMLIDNTLWYGRVLSKENCDYSTRAIQDFNEGLKSDQRVELSLLPIYDGLTIVYKK